MQTLVANDIPVTEKHPAITSEKLNRSANLTKTQNSDIDNPNCDPEPIQLPNPSQLIPTTKHQNLSSSVHSNFNFLHSRLRGIPLHAFNGKIQETVRSTCFLLQFLSPCDIRHFTSRWPASSSCKK